MAAYNKIYEIYARLERESEQYELILGDGLLNWNHPTGLIRHPILLMRLKLEFDPSVPVFSLIESEQPVELYTSLFRSVPEVTGTVMNSLNEELEQKPFHPLGGQETEEFLKRLVAQLSPYGQVLQAEDKPIQAESPWIIRDPMIFMRKRSLGFSKAVEEIIKDIPERDELPGFLENIVGVDHDILPLESNEPVRCIDPNGEDEEILLSKPANSEQLQIADRLNRYSAVLVQGPPGTGKTHTIANLIGHFLAQGKSILVTSHTSKALSVLHEKIVPPLQPLCLSVLTDDSRKQLESTVDAITERLANSNADQLEQEALVLQKDRIEILKKLRETRQKLLQARADEYRPVVIAGEEYDPAQSARQVYELRESAKWIPSPVRLSAALPLSARELEKLYHTNTTLTYADEKELGYSLPDPEQLISPHEFENLVANFLTLSGEELALGKEYWLPSSGLNSEPLESQLIELEATVKVIQSASNWQLSLLEAGMLGEEYQSPWQNLITQIERTCTTSVNSKEALLEYNPLVQEHGLPHEVEAVLEEIIEHLKDGGSLNFFTLITKGNWKTLINLSQVNSKPPSRPEHFAAIKALIDLRNNRTRLLERWERQVTVLQGPKPTDLGFEPEYSGRQFVAFITESLEWYTKRWTPLVEKLQTSGFQWKAFYEKTTVQLGNYGELRRLEEAVSHELSRLLTFQAKRLALIQLETQIDQLKSIIERAQGSSAHVSHKLLTAIQDLHAPRYREAYQRLVDLKDRALDLKLRKELLARLEKAAPVWATEILQRKGHHGQGSLPGNPAEAWLWRQFVDELDDRAKKSMEELLNQITYLSKQLRDKTAVLVEKKAWAAQVRRTTVRQRQALNGWKQLMHRIGKGTGKRAPGFRMEARKLMPICQSAVPVWIMPLSRVVENFNPRTNRFDVVIIDEASQADVLALAALYLGKQVIVVGDNEQVSPSAVGQKQEETDKLIDEHLVGIPNAKLYDGLFSIYDLAGTAFQPICLREHFRCVTPIIQFSNYLSYQGKIKPLRDESTVKVRPHTVAYRVQDGTSYKKVNVNEAQVVASLIIACTEQPEYQAASMGVISLVGEEQAGTVDRLLQQYLSAEDYKKRKIQCGNPAQFQGDERDIIFLSLVDASAGEGPLNKRGEGANEMFKKRYNVAASRARDQLWVVYSLDPENDLKPGDLRGELIKHAKDPQAIIKMLDTAEKESESEFEKQVLFRLRQASYSVHPQWKVGGYRIDMVVESGGQRVALECDGDKWHTEENLAQDMARQAILERLGWRFIRIRGSEYFRDPEGAMQKIFERLTYFEMSPEGIVSESNSLETEGDDLKARVIRRADTIRRLWNGEDPEPVSEPVIDDGVRQQEGLAQDDKAKQFRSVMLINNGEASCLYDFTPLEKVDAELAKYTSVQKTEVSQYIPVQLFYCPTCNKAYINNSINSHFIRLAAIKYLTIVPYTP
ncbi:putative DNA helicase [Desulfosporosinus metallidurans]|uniref:Putative DNA helicase n=1 Tax=Desulfosporosinus metallidurans TaxID=1888891 RepID=A0A1Q8QL08_9FIRM|nr:putative DNA helicase [Desulfosporosinus metallidurans]